MAGVVLNSTVKAYSAVQVVHGVDLRVREQESVVLVGPSGCGKSTSLRMIAGLEEITSIYVTHDQVEAMTLADRIVVMHDGRIEQIGTPMELFLNPANAFVAGFLGAPPMNQISAVIADGTTGPVAEFAGQKISLAPLPGLQNAVGRGVIVGIRPEYSQIVTEAADAAIIGDLDLVETLGSEALLHLTVAGEPFVIRTETLGNINKLNAVKGFIAPLDLIKVSDANTGLALSGQTRVE